MISQYEGYKGGIRWHLRSSNDLAHDVGGAPPEELPVQGASSDVFIGEAMRLMRENGYRLGNLDATIIAEVTSSNAPTHAAERRRCLRASCWRQSGKNMKQWNDWKLRRR